MINEFNYSQPEKFDHYHLVYHFTVPLNLEILTLMTIFEKKLFNVSAAMSSSVTSSSFSLRTIFRSFRFIRKTGFNCFSAIFCLL